MDDAELEELEWRKWRNNLKLVPIAVQGHELAMQHSSENEPLLMIVDAILAGPNGWYLQGQCPGLGGLRTFAVERIAWIKTPDEVHFDSFHEWLVNRATIAPAVADELGWILPPKSERR